MANAIQIQKGGWGGYFSTLPVMQVVQYKLPTRDDSKRKCTEISRHAHYHRLRNDVDVRAFSRDNNVYVLRLK